MKSHIGFARNGEHTDSLLKTMLTLPTSSNLLYPREDRTLNRLLYVCKSCNSAQEHDSACTYRQNLSEAAQESMGEKAFVSRDPTVRETKSSSEEDMQEFCTMCGQCLKCSTCGEGGVEDMDQDSQETADTSMS